MSWFRFLRRSRWDDERARELEAHLAIEIDENLARGMSARDARDAARRKLGNTTQIREEIYRMNTIGVLDTIWQDLRYGARLLRLNRSFTLVAVLSLALGVGANTALFQLLDALRIRTLPVAHPEQLVEIRIQKPKGREGGFTGRRPALTNPLWERIRDRQGAFSSVFAWDSPAFELSAGGESRTAEGLWVSGDFFQALDVRPLFGRVTRVGRRSARLRGAPGGHQLRLLAARIWRRPVGARPVADPRRPQLRHRRRDAARFLWRRSRPRL